MTTETLDTFLLYYVCWHEHEFDLQEMKKLLLGELGPDGLSESLKEFRALWTPYHEAGDRRTYYKIEYAPEDKKK